MLEQVPGDVIPALSYFKIEKTVKLDRQVAWHSQRAFPPLRDTLSRATTEAVHSQGTPAHPPSASFLAPHDSGGMKQRPAGGNK